MSKMMLYTIGDVKDWHALKLGQYVKNKQVFLLDEALEEINSVVNFNLKLSNKKIKFIFEPNFSKVAKNDVFVELVQTEQI